MNTQENLKRIEEVVEMSNEQREAVLSILRDITLDNLNKGFRQSLELTKEMSNIKLAPSSEDTFNYIKDRYGSKEYWEYVNPKC
tara:strand:+ start:1336 stop:1587 length:252 start_codon:yes stop_codon:yes gene_type:complete